MKRDQRLTKTAKLIAVTLVDDFAHHSSGRCNPFVETLCEATGDPERTVQKGLAELEACGWITRSKGRGRGRASEITFTAYASRGAIIPQNVAELAAYQERDTADSRAGKVQQTAPIKPDAGSERVQQAAQKGAASCGSLLKPKDNQTARASGGPRKPTLNQSGVARFGGDCEARWNEWLAEKNWPTLAELGEAIRDAGGRGWEVPFRQPPCDDSTQQRITDAWLEWATWHMERRLAATG